METSICLLVINRIETLPVIAVNSILRLTNTKIYIGYLDREHVSDLLLLPNTVGLDLSEQAVKYSFASSSSNYREFGSLDFFKLVQLKWDLITEVNKIANPEILIYSDLDLIWLRNPINICLNFFSLNQKCKLLIQDMTSDPCLPKLCMGFACFKGGEGLEDFVRNLSSLHKNLLMNNPKIGDDDVVTQYFLENSATDEIRLLPQTTFPTGNLISLFLKSQPLPGMKRVDPYIFHANFVVGLRKKLLLLYIFSKQFGSQKESFSTSKRASYFIEYQIRRVKYFLYKVKK